MREVIKTWETMAAGYIKWDDLMLLPEEEFAFGNEWVGKRRRTFSFYDRYVLMLCGGKCHKTMAAGRMGRCGRQAIIELYNGK